MIFNFNLDCNEMDLYVMINLFGDVIFDIDVMYLYGVVQVCLIWSLQDKKMGGKVLLLIINIL